MRPDSPIFQSASLPQSGTTPKSKLMSRCPNLIETTEPRPVAADRVDGYRGDSHGMPQKGTSMLSRLLLAAAFTGLISYSASSQHRPPDSAELQRIENLVSKAAELVNAKGKAAFSEFWQRDSEWWKGNVYVFA
jgi:hypothetical protein